MKGFTTAASACENNRTMNMHNNTTFEDLESFDWDLNSFDDNFDFVNPKRTQIVKSTQHNSMSNNKMEYSIQESTSKAFSTQTSITSTQDNFSQNKMECSSQESMSSTNNMDISSQESSVCDKMYISSQETTLGKSEISSELKKTDESESTFVAKYDSYSRIPDVYEHCSISSSYKAEYYPRLVSGNAQNTQVSSPVVEIAEETVSESKGTRFSLHKTKSPSHETLAYSKAKNLPGQQSSYNVHNFDKDAKSQSMSVSDLISSEKTEITQVGMNISSSRGDANLFEPSLSNEKKFSKITSSENMDNLSIVKREDKAHKICFLNEDYKVQSSINFCTQEKIINCEAMSISSQGSSGSQAMDISSQETVNINEETVFEMNNSKKKEMPQTVIRGIEEPFLARKRCCCGKNIQIQKNILNSRKRHRAMMRKENALKNREIRIAEREAAVLRREGDLKVREQKILNYEAAVFHSVK